MGVSGPGKRRITAALIMTAGGLLRLYHIGYQSLWLDEAHKTFNALKSAREILAQGIQNLDCPYHFMLHFWIKAFGQSEAAIRMFSCIPGIIFLLLIYKASGDMISRKAQIPSLVLATISPIHIFYSQEAAVYSLVILCSLASVWLLHRSLRSDSTITWAGFAATTVFLIYILAHGIFIFAAEIFYVLFRFKRSIMREKKCLIALASVALISLPKAVLLLIQVKIDANPWIPDLEWDFPIRTFAYFSLLGVNIPRLITVKTAMILGFPCLVFMFFKGLLQTQGAGSLLRFYFLAPLALTIATSLRKANYCPGRYEVVIFPALLLIIAAGYAASRNKLLKAIVGLCIIVASGLVLHTYYFAYNKSNDRELMQIIRKNVSQDDVLLFTDLTIAQFYYYSEENEYPHAISFLPYYHQGWVSRRSLNPDEEYIEMRLSEFKEKAYPLLTEENELYVFESLMYIDEFLLKELRKDLEFIREIPLSPGDNPNPVIAVHVFRKHVETNG